MGSLELALAAIKDSAADRIHIGQHGGARLALVNGVAH
jgi:hypothetical protein